MNGLIVKLVAALALATVAVPAAHAGDWQVSMATLLAIVVICLS